MLEKVSHSVVVFINEMAFYSLGIFAYGFDLWNKAGLKNSKFHLKYRIQVAYFVSFVDKKFNFWLDLH